MPVADRKSGGVRPRRRLLSLHGQRKQLKKRRPDPPSLWDSLRCSSGQAAVQLALAVRTLRALLRSSNSARRNPLTILRYSVADKGLNAELKEYMQRL